MTEPKIAEKRMQKEEMECYLGPVGNHEMKSNTMQNEDSETKIMAALKDVIKVKENMEDNTLHEILEGCEKLENDVEEHGMAELKIKRNETYRCRFKFNV
ncbi:uncharacterized protein LOC126907240 isoform X2 [Daktulosphaira vitifoliae]|uniref:uncharacterized protein LOC126907240 isoform X2 n=1 Tax=Daktulosphaira vitifoliae TaxID=58002 RepID=UPI0021A9A1E6|nr:uncharacterized protein LOC126907240 isoform X2 [Daktulosphaira vitifoliae]